MENIEPKTRIEKILNKIADNVGGGDSSSESNKLVVTFSGNGETSACDKTYAEIDAAYKSGKEVEGRYGAFVLRLMRAASQFGFYEFYCYLMTDFSEETFYEVYAGVQSDGSVDVRTNGDA